MRSVRLDKKTEEILAKASTILGESKSNIIKESLTAYCNQVIEEKKKKPYSVYLNLIQDIKAETSKKGSKKSSKTWQDDFKKHIRKKNWQKK